MVTLYLQFAEDPVLLFRTTVGSVCGYSYWSRFEWNMIYALRTRNEIPFHSAIHLYKSSSSFVPVCMGVDKLLPFGICNSYFANGQDAVAYKSTNGTCYCFLLLVDISIFQCF